MATDSRSKLKLPTTALTTQLLFCKVLPISSGYFYLKKNNYFVISCSAYSQSFQYLFRIISFYDFPIQEQPATLYHKSGYPPPPLVGCCSLCMLPNQLSHGFFPSFSVSPSNLYFSGEVKKH